MQMSRQPIFNNSQKLFAYKLLFREETDNYFNVIDGDRDTCNML